MASADLTAAERLLRHGCPDEQVERATGATLSDILGLRASFASTTLNRAEDADGAPERAPTDLRPA